MTAHEAPLLFIERARLVEDGVRDGDLADVVQLGGAFDLVELGVAEPQLLAGRARQRGDLADVLAELGSALG